MQSPFYSSPSNTIVMYLEPYLNRYYKAYENIITLSDMPTGPLADLVTPLSFPKLSPFQDPPPFFSNPMNCTYVLLRYSKSQCPGNPSLKTIDYFMTAEDIPAIFSYLRSNGYTIDTELTKLLTHSKIKIGGPSDKKISGDRKMICFFTHG